MINFGREIFSREYDLYANQARREGKHFFVFFFAVEGKVGPARVIHNWKNAVKWKFEKQRARVRKTEFFIFSGPLSSFSFFFLFSSFFFFLFFYYGTPLRVELTVRGEGRGF